MRTDNIDMYLKSRYEWNGDNVGMEKWQRKERGMGYQCRKWKNIRKRDGRRLQQSVVATEWRKISKKSQKRQRKL